MIEQFEKPFVSQVSAWWRRYQEGLSAASPAAYIFAFACVSIATFLRAAFGWLEQGQGLFFAPYYPTILLVSLLRGPAPGLLATVLSMAVVWRAFVFGSLGLEIPPEDLTLRFALFFAMALIIVNIAQCYRSLMRIIDAS
jgi:K+-sensing histidine kinase KdpD